MHIVKTPIDSSQNTKMETITLAVQRKYQEESQTLVALKDKNKKGETWFSLFDNIPPGDLNFGRFVSKSEMNNLQFLNPGSYREIFSIVEDGIFFHAYTTKDLPQEVIDKILRITHDVLLDLGYTEQQITNLLPKSLKSRNNNSLASSYRSV